MRKATGADVAIVGAGSLGLNQNLHQRCCGSSRWLDIFRFDDIVAVREVSPKVVCDALRHGFGGPAAARGRISAV